MRAHTRWLLTGLSVLVAWSAAAPAAVSTDDQADIEWRAFRTFSSADGMPQNSVLALLQDAEGFIYAGTQGGLARYDGRGWQPIPLPITQRSFAVGALLQAADGAIWVGTDSVGAWRLEGGQVAAVPLPPAAGGVNAFWQGPDGRVWVASYGGLYRCGRGACDEVEAIGSRGARSLLGEQVGGEPRLWVGTQTAGVLRLQALDASQPRPDGTQLTRRDGLPNNVGLSLAHFAGALWIGSGRGLARHDGHRLQAFAAEEGLPAAMVFALQVVEGDDGRQLLWATLRPGGVAEIEVDGRWRLIDGGLGLPSNATHSLLRERYRGSLWIGTMSAGIARLERDRWVLFDERLGLPDRQVLGLGIAAGDGRLWAGTAAGAVQWRDGTLRPLLPPPHQQALVHDLLDTPDGSRWIAHGRGLQRWREGELDAGFSVDNSALPAVSADRLALRRNGDGPFEVFVGTGHGLARWRADLGLQRVELPAVAADVSVRAFSTVADPALAGTDLLWVATSQGVFRLDRSGWRREARDCVDAASVLDLAVEADERSQPVLWLAGRDGLRRLGPDGRCDDWPAVADIGTPTRLQLAGEHLYVFGTRAALRLRRDGPANQTGLRYGPSAGLISPEIVASAVDARGRVFAATAVGLAALEPASARSAGTATAPLRLLRAVHGETQQPLLPGTVLAHDDSSAHFEFALIAFDREHALRYRVQLEGLQAAAGPWTSRTEASFPRLPPGAFRLRVEAEDADGGAAEPIELSFGVATPWWRQTWAQLCVALLMLMAGLLLGRWRLHTIQRRAAQLAAEVELRTGELAAANRQLEEAAISDPLTGLRNRRYFALAAPAEVERARRGEPGKSLLIALLDIDHFKRINDSLGHDAGDAVLVEIARRLQQTARGGDFVLRWGGEEFLLLLRDVDRHAAGELLRRLLDALAGAPVALAGSTLTVSASIGGVCFPFDPAAPREQGLEQAISLADAALYRAKREGRDRAVLAQPAGHDPPDWVTVERVPPG